MFIFICMGIIHCLLYLLMSRMWCSRCRFLQQEDSLLVFIPVAVFQYGICQASGKICLALLTLLPFIKLEKYVVCHSTSE